MNIIITHANLIKIQLIGYITEMGVDITCHWGVGIMKMYVA